MSLQHNTSPIGNKGFPIDGADSPPTIGGMMHTSLIERLHATPWRGVIAITGGGSGALPSLLTVPGASATVLEAVIPYSEKSLTEWLGTKPCRACDEATARQLAMRSYERARDLSPDSDPGELFGLGCTASLASTRPKRGEHRAHLAVQTASETRGLSLFFEKGRRSRAEEEDATAHAVVALLAHTAGVHALDLTKTPPGIEATTHNVVAPVEWTELLLGQRQSCVLNGAPEAGSQGLCLLPGSFNPFHAGHAEIARIAGDRTSREVVLELSLANVDKPPLDFIEIQRRLATIPSRSLWLTKAPAFLQKATLAPGAVFAVGVDTIERIAQGRYYASELERDAAFDTIAAQGCRFLVFGRVKEGRFEGVDDLALPPKLRALCDTVTEREFRLDVSSTELRGNQ